jgi:hypothetical protein
MGLTGPNFGTSQLNQFGRRQNQKAAYPGGGEWGNGYQDMGVGGGGGMTTGGGSTGGDSSGGIDWSSLLGLLQGGYGLGNAIGNPGGMNMGQVINLGREAGRLSDPFGPQRGQYQTQLNSLMSDPNSITQSPAYQFRLNQGIGAIDAGAAAKGMLGSGNRMMELEQFGQGLASQEYDNQFNRLALLSGATTGSPAAAGSNLMEGLRTGYQMDQNRTSDIGRSLGMLGQGNLLSSGLGAMGGLLGRLGSGASSFLQNLFGGNMSMDDINAYLQSQGGAVDNMWGPNAGSGDFGASDLQNMGYDMSDIGSYSGDVPTDLGDFFG